VGEFDRRLLRSLAHRDAPDLGSTTVLGHVLLTALGLLLIILGFWGGHECPKPYDALVAWCAPIGLIIMLAGVVLLFIPNFFS
jgi:hypothetical protein